LESVRTKIQKNRKNSITPEQDEHVSGVLPHNNSVA
jgi:hypothetical protein